MTSVILARMQVHAAAGENEAALGDWELALARHRGRGPLGAGWLEDQACAAQLLVATGRRAEATALAAEALDVARRWNTPGAIGQALRTCARVGPAEDAVPTLDKAVAQLERSPARAELARALADSEVRCAAAAIACAVASPCARRSLSRTNAAPTDSPRQLARSSRRAECACGGQRSQEPIR
jgi:hypothetical protein